jgi:hypothetical protein
MKIKIRVNAVLCQLKKQDLQSDGNFEQLELSYFVGGIVKY